MVVEVVLKILRSFHGGARREDLEEWRIVMLSAYRRACLWLLVTKHKRRLKLLTCAQSSNSSLQNIKARLQLLIARTKT